MIRNFHPTEFEKSHEFSLVYLLRTVHHSFFHETVLYTSPLFQMILTILPLNHYFKFVTQVESEYIVSNILNSIS